MDCSLRVVFVAVALLTAPIASQGQQECDLPTVDDVTSVGEVILVIANPEGTSEPDITTTRIHFTCLATVALDKYAWASVVVNFTTSDDPDVVQVEQFELRCVNGAWQVTPDTFDPNLPSMPFDIVPQYQCSGCSQSAPTGSEYDPDSNCIRCASECLNNGGGFCTGSGASDCCPAFNSDTGACVEDNCTTIDPDFGPNEDFVCVCNITCDPGFTRNDADCSCELTDGCEAAGQPCQNGGTCMSDLTAMPYYTCQCPPQMTGQNCSIPFLPCHDDDNDGINDDDVCTDCDTTLGCCRNCSEEYNLVGCNCTKATEPPRTPTTPPPTGVCPENCRCSGRDPTCCTECPTEDFIIVDCQCIDEGRTLAAGQVAGIAIGIVLLVLFLLALAVLLAYVVYYMWTNNQKLKKGTTQSPFSNGESHSNPLYLTPEEVGDD